VGAWEEVKVRDSADVCVLICGIAWCLYSCVCMPRKGIAAYDLVEARIFALCMSDVHSVFILVWRI
jgi:hypothetical protein